MPQEAPLGLIDETANLFQDKDRHMKNCASKFRLFQFFAAVALSIPATYSLAADLTADARIDHVTVYRQGAVVTRVAELAVSADLTD